MMLNNNIRLIMGKQRIDNIHDLMERTGLSRNALNKLWHEENLEAIKLGTLIKICDSLNVSLSDLIEYVPDSTSRIIRTSVKRTPVKDEPTDS